MSKCFAPNGVCDAPLNCYGHSQCRYTVEKNAAPQEGQSFEAARSQDTDRGQAEPAVAAPVAWRWRNRGGQWWYSETLPVNGENYVSEKAEIQPLYAGKYDPT